MAFLAPSRFDYSRRCLPTPRYDDARLTPRLAIPTYDYIFRHGRLLNGAVFEGLDTPVITETGLCNTTGTDNFISYVPAGLFGTERGLHFRADKMTHPPADGALHYLVRIVTSYIVVAVARDDTKFSVWVAEDGQAAVSRSFAVAFQADDEFVFDVFLNKRDVTVLVDDQAIAVVDFVGVLNHDVTLITYGAGVDPSENWQGCLGPARVRQLELSIDIIDGSEYVVDDDADQVVQG